VLVHNSYLREAMIRRSGTLVLDGRPLTSSLNQGSGGLHES
jgi:hypothetical protein